MSKNSKRPLDGVILLNKPLGLSSNQALQRVKRLLRAQKAGHTGALDPLATGMLPLCFGEATKFSQYLLDADKRYLTRIHLGVRTTTGDREGDVLLQSSVPTLSAFALETVLARFRGQIEQVPPMYSALKHEGKPLYEYARKGIVLERKRRHVTISQLIVTDFSPPFLTLDIICSKGTYIRTIGEDIGEALGCGAHLDSLHRLYTAGYEQASMFTLEQLEQRLMQNGELGLDTLLLPTDSPVANLPKMFISAEQVQDLVFGRVLDGNGGFDKPTLVRLYNQSTDAFVGLGQVDHYVTKAYRLLNTSELQSTK